MRIDCPSRPKRMEKISNECRTETHKGTLIREPVLHYQCRSEHLYSDARHVDLWRKTMLLFVLTAVVLITDEISFVDLSERQIVQLVTKRDESFFRAVKGVENGKLKVMDISTLEEQTFEKSQLKAIRTTLTDRNIAEGVGVGSWLAWQLMPIFEGAAKRQTVASIQQAAVYVTANRYSGLMVGDQVDVFRLGEPIKDPNTGEVLETPEQKIAKLEVMSFSEKLVTCRPTGEFVIQLQVGDVIRPVQPRTSVAVLPFMNGGGEPVQSGVEISDAMTNAMANLGVPTLERARTVEILGEQLRQLSPVYDGGDASRVGKLLGAATLVTGRLIENTENKRMSKLSLRLLDVRTGTILKSVELELTSSKLKLSRVSLFNLPNMPSASTAASVAGKTRVEENSLGMKFVLLPAGEFIMGSPESEREPRPEETQHSVTLTLPFQLGMHEVTQAQYESVMGANPSNFTGPNNPVEQVSWDDAMEFCRRLSELPKEAAAGYKYRLPTEAEWEYACRAGAVTAYSFGNDASNLSEYAWFERNSRGTTHQVGQKKANSWGLYDMHGNVWEWCLDWKGNVPSGAVTDPQGPPSGTERSDRGGSWSDSPIYLRSAIRGYIPPDARVHSLGFRVLR